MKALIEWVEAAPAFGKALLVIVSGLAGFVSGFAAVRDLPDDVRANTEALERIERVVCLILQEDNAPLAERVQCAE